MNGPGHPDLIGRLLDILGALQGPVQGKPITNLPPFVTDTLFPISGGKVPIYRSSGFSPLGPENTAMTVAPPRPQQGDTAVVFYKEPRDEVYAHEIGHVLDHRNLVPLVLALAEAKRRPYLGQGPKTMDEYFRSNRDEYVAEAFARAILSGRKGFSDSTKVEKNFPGSIDIIHWLLQQELFKPLISRLANGTGQNKAP